MICCGNCFDDDFLTEQIAEISQEDGDCPTCGSTAVPITEAKNLTDVFDILQSLYSTSRNDTDLHLAPLLRRDWHLGTPLSDAVLTNLLSEIFPNFDAENTRFRPNTDQDSSLLTLWDDFRQELKHSNRYFPIKIPNKEHLEGLVELLSNKSQLGRGSLVYRARRGNADLNYRLDDMGMPPIESVSEGRANPFGIPYLYTASDISTAIAEVRPYKGEIVHVATFYATEDFILADLRNPRRTISPFSLEEETLSSVYRNLNYLSHLGLELSKPILPQVAKLEYLPTQYLCELIKHSGFDGVIYRSSVALGHNFALFSDSKVAIQREIQEYRITEVTYEHEPR